MFNFLLGYFIPKEIIYIRISRDSIWGKNVQSGAEIKETASPSFSHPRALIGDFTVADRLIRKIIKALRKNQFLSPSVLIQPTETIEGGLYQIEERVLRELGYGAGANKVIIWVGANLTDYEVTQKLS